MEPGETILSDEAFRSEHNVKCDESGATGESNTIKKVLYEEWSKIGNESAHTDWCMISGSRILID